MPRGNEREVERRAAPRSATGRTSTWTMYILGQNDAAPGNGAPQISAARFAPTKGIERATEYPIASPMPDSRSSASE